MALMLTVPRRRLESPERNLAFHVKKSFSLQTRLSPSGISQTAIATAHQASIAMRVTIQE
jgi:hypothetical protein